MADQQSGDNQNGKQNEKPSKEAKAETVRELIEAYTMRIRAIRQCADEHLRLAWDNQFRFLTGWLKKSMTAVVLREDGKKTLTFSLEDGHFEEWVGNTTLFHPDILGQSLLIFGFSALDAFIGLLLKKLYNEQPSLIYKLEEKEVKVSELLNSKDLQEVIDAVIERDVSSLLRTSYDDMLSKLANRHGLDSLKKFPNWPKFIEAAQRRNLVTHCSGVVNSQYLNSCKAAGVDLDDGVVAGAELKVSQEYLSSALDILYEVGVKLAHTLWRKSLPDKIKESEKALTDELFELLTREQWELAKTLGQFALTVPGPKEDLQFRICQINYAQAMKWSGDNEGAQKVLDSIDLSASIRDLKLGVEVLRGNFTNAAKLMRDIGKEGEIVLQSGYRTWPVFREFRKSEQFKAAFLDIYGIEFAEENKVEEKPDHKSARDLVDFLKSINADTIPDQSTSDGEAIMPSEKPIQDEPEQPQQGVDERQGD